MQLKIAFKAIFLWRRKEYGVEVGKFSRAEPQSAPHNATSVIGDPAEQDSQEEGERDERIGTRLFARPLAKTQQVAGMQGCPE